MLDQRLEFRILGPLEIDVDGRPVNLGGGRLRALVAALLVCPGQVLTPDQLIEDLWEGRAPASARMSLHNLVSALRRQLPGSILETVSAGYAVRVAPDQLDAHRFEHLVLSAQNATARERVAILDAALTLWRGSPLVDVRYESFAQAEILRLEELHLWALEQRLEARLELGACDAIVPELTGLAHRFPYRELTRALLVLALHRAGRTAEALTSYAEWHGQIRASLGTEWTELVSTQMCAAVRLRDVGLADVLTRMEAGRASAGIRRPRTRRARRMRPRSTSAETWAQRAAAASGGFRPQTRSRQWCGGAGAARNGCESHGVLHDTVAERRGTRLQPATRRFEPVRCLLSIRKRRRRIET